MQEHELPTRAEMFRRASACVDQAYANLGDAADWLRSDWQPLNTSLSNAQGDARSTAFEQLGEAKSLLNDIKLGLQHAADSNE